jgi:hypothetical protein
MHGFFYSDPWNGSYFIAERAGRGLRGAQKFIWSKMPVKPTAGPERVDPAYVPYHIRRQAYRHFAKPELK